MHDPEQPFPTDSNAISNPEPGPDFAVAFPWKGEEADLTWYTSEKLERPPMTAKPGLHLLIRNEFNILWRL